PLPNPFGEPVRGQAMPVEQKRDFAKAVDLEPLRTLAVLHDGRVKILDTLARETVQRITGRRDFRETIEAPGGRATSVRYDPLFTFLDLLIDPGYYIQKPLVGVDYLPFREEVLAQAFPESEPEQKRWLHSLRLSPVQIISYGGAVLDNHQGQGLYHDALNKAEMALEVFN